MGRKEPFGFNPVAGRQRSLIASNRRDLNGFFTSGDGTRNQFFAKTVQQDGFTEIGRPQG